MQYKKKATIDKLMDAGREEFLLCGFRGASIRDIAKRAGIAVSNFYRYFDGKESLLERILEPAYNQTFATIEHLSRYEQSLQAVTFSQVASVFIDKILDLFEIYGKELLILFDKCQSTRFEDFLIKIGATTEAIISEKLFSNPTPADIHFSGIIAHAFINSVFEILKHPQSRPLMAQMLSRLLIFYFASLNGRV